MCIRDRQDLPENQVKTLIKKYEDLISKHSGKILKIEEWGIRNFSHIINNNKKGYYFHIKFVPSNVPSEVHLKELSLRLLSSGEKALTAISLLFAIYQVKPSPYCILDEVDAPLDDVNIHKFTKVLKQFSDETQFIIVTHNKLTMEIANHMYGVTQEKKGVSKLVSVSFD